MIGALLPDVVCAGSEPWPVVALVSISSDSGADGEGPLTCLDYRMYGRAVCIHIPKACCVIYKVYRAFGHRNDSFVDGKNRMPVALVSFSLGVPAQFRKAS